MSEIQRLQNTDGIELVQTAYPEDPPKDDVLGRSILAARAAKEDMTIVLSSSKIVVTLWPDLHIAVQVTPGHPVNKSLTRMLRRMGRRIGGLGVQSDACPSPPAASSNDTTAASSPSPEASTAPTGASPEDVSSQENNPS